MSKTYLTYTALITPFLDTGAIDWLTFDHLFTRQMTEHIDGIVLFGSTGEWNALSIQERVSIIRRAVALKGTNRLTIMAATGLSQTDQTVNLTSLCLDSGCDSVLVVTPPYVKANIDGLIRHYEEVCKAAGSADRVCLYHVPARTGQKLTLEDLVRILQHTKITKIKESSQDLTLLKDLAIHPELSDLYIFSGDDHLYYDSLHLGAQGVISVMSNLFPDMILKMTKAFEGRSYDEGYAIHQKLQSLYSAMSPFSNPLGIKTLLALEGLAKPYNRLPLMALKGNERQSLVLPLLVTKQAFMPRLEQQISMETRHSL